MVAAVSVVSTIKKNSYQQRFLNIVGAANALDNSGVQDIFEIDVEGLVRVGVDLVVATNALAAFQIQAKFSVDSAAYRTIRSTAAQFITPSGVLIDASGDLTILAVGSTGWFIMDVAGMSKIKIRANSSAAGGSTLAIAGSGV